MINKDEFQFALNNFRRATIKNRDEEATRAIGELLWSAVETQQRQVVALERIADVLEARR